ncbi:UvrD-helicase domain-containing protein [Mycoplasma sp. P36-A1]|uniref:UvrD-helicase domain-containing protein n=1 Tax=Mycoplasma sp. P36-A1 TaxID=3252900 RepID=UPI003C2C1A5F
MNNNVYVPEPYFTEEQKNAIFKEGNNILVSAAAGCGKTTLMVQRIIRKIVNDRVSINQLVVVTFTEAAASELKQRLEEELNITLKKDLDQDVNNFLIHQLAILNDSYISTFHSLCLRLLKENMAEFKFEKPINIADSRTIRDLKMKAFNKLMNEYINDKELLQLDDFFNSVSDESTLFNIIDKTLTTCNSKGGISQFKNKVELNSDNIYEIEPYAAILIDAIDPLLNRLLNNVQEALNTDGFTKNNIDTHTQFLNIVEKALSDFNNRVNYDTLYNLTQVAKPRKGSSNALKTNLEYQILDSDIKECFEKLKKIVLTNENNILHVIKDNDYNVNILLKYVEIYKFYLEEYKYKSGYLEFDDLENYLLNILYNNDGSFSDIAISLKPKFNEIMIDEYQDTSSIQEAITKAISNGKNIFMVGDIKQSIYRFRNATSALFADKYEKYQDGKLGDLIELSYNFRSLPGVLESTNFIFKNIFSKSLGGINYDASNQLNFGNKNLLEKFPGQYNSKIIINTNAESNGKKLTVSKKWQASALIAAQQIRKMVDDSANNDLNQRIKYSDFAILTRNRAGWDAIETALKDNNIDYMAHGLVGFFETYEIRDLLNILEFVVNKDNDVALLGVLHSYFCNLNEAEILEISTICIPENKYASLYSKLRVSKYNEVFNFLEDILLNSYSLAPTNLIDYIYDNSLYHERIFSHNNYESFLMSISRFKNIIEANMDYYNSLEKLLIGINDTLSSSKDEDSVAVLSSQDNVVNIMTIHKSKGLEFKYVIMLDEAKINKKTKVDRNNISVLDNKLVLAPFNIATRTVLANDKNKSLNPIKPLIDFYDENEIISEELRILYVALTRAKLQLIIIRTVDNDDLHKIASSANQNIDWSIPITTLRDYGSLSDYIIASISRHKDGLNIRDSIAASSNDDIYLYDTHLFDVQLINFENDETTVFENKLNTYPYLVVNKSDKKISKYDTIRPSDHGQQALDFSNIGDYDPFMMGNMTHLLLEELNFNSTEINDDILYLTNLYKVNQNMINGINSFVNDDFFNIIRNSNYIKEYSFIYFKNDKSMNGIIDLYVETLDTIYIVDYKTDRLSEKELVVNYSDQLNTYKNVLSITTTKPIKNMIYSLYNKKFIVL